jgi:hypothetical protein
VPPYDLHDLAKDLGPFDSFDRVIAGIASGEQGTVRGQGFDAMADEIRSLTIDHDISHREVVRRADLKQVAFVDRGKHAPRDDPQRSALQNREPILVGQLM